MNYMTILLGILLGDLLWESYRIIFIGALRALDLGVFLGIFYGIHIG